MKKEWSIRLEASGLAAGYDGKSVIREVDLTVRSGEVLALIGPNGAGKSTLLKAIAGQLQPRAGTVLLCGRNRKEIPETESAKQMSALFTDRASAEYMTCREAVAAGRYPYTGMLGILSGEDWACVDRAMERMGASELAELPFEGISDGQRQRVLLARALCQEPEVLVLDEPASYLDLRYQLELTRTLRSLAEQEELAVIVSLHETDLVRRCADRVLCLRDGRVVRQGTPEEVCSGEMLEELYGLPAGSLTAGGRDADGGAGQTGTEEHAHRTGPVQQEKAEAPGSTGQDHPSEPARFAYYTAGGGKRLRCGFTTGTCAALAASGAARRLLTGIWPETVTLVTPAGLPVEVPLEAKEEGPDYARCGVRKDAGDDTDVTADLLICAEVRASAEPGIRILGGEGVGTVTKPGLDQPVGEAAVNSVPRRMIREAVGAVLADAESGEAGTIRRDPADNPAEQGNRTDTEEAFPAGLTVTVSVPGGREAAEKTFNPKLGIEGGISILGTSGIVRPMSLQAMIDTIALELRQHAAEGCRRLILTPGNYGAEFLKEQGLDTLGIPVVRCSNFLGDALDEIRILGYEEVLLAGHVGKLVKAAGGIMNTHSRQADCRRELFCAHAALAGGELPLLKGLMDCATTDACLALLTQHGLREPVMRSLTEAVSRHVCERAGDACRTGVLLFSNVYGLLGMSETAEELLTAWK